MDERQERIGFINLYQIIWDIFIYGQYYKDIDKLDFEELPKLLGLTKIPSYVFCISIDDYSHMTEQDRHWAKSFIEDIIVDILGKREYILLFAHQNCFYLSGHASELQIRKEDSKHYPYLLQNLAEKIKDKTKESKLSLTIGIDSYEYPSSVEKWREIAQHAIVAQRRKFFEGKNRIYFYEPSKELNNITYKPTLSKVYSEIRHKLLNAIVKGDIEKAKENSKILVKEIFRYNLSRLFYLRIKLIEASILLICDLIELGFFEPKLSQLLIEFIEEVNSLHDIINLAEAFYNLVDYLTNLAEKLECKLNPIILKVKEVVESSEELSDITLNKISHIVNVSYTYLSRLFRKELGISFTEYVNRERIKRAFPLLFDKQKRIEDIAIYAGFKDLQQFERVFKRFYNTTPIQYRRINLSKRRS